MIENIQDQSFAQISPYIPARRSRYQHLRQQRQKRSLVYSTQSSITKLKKSLADSSQFIYQQPQIQKQCRICWDQHQTQQNIFTSPCKCTGSLKYVHDKCYRQWLMRQLQQKTRKQRQQILKRGIQCEVCKQKIYLNFKQSYRCCNKQHMVQICQDSCLIMVVFMIYIMINTSCLGYLVYYTITNGINFKKQPLIGTFQVCGYILLGSTLVLGIFFFFKDYLVDRATVLQSYQSYRIVERAPNNKVHPQSSSAIIQEIN